MTSTSPKMRRATCCLTILAIALGLSACRDNYLDRRDAVTLGFGEANAHNRVVQTINPAPRAAYRRPVHDAEMIRHGVEGHRAKPVGQSTQPLQDAGNATDRN